MLRSASQKALQQALQKELQGIEVKIS